MRQEFVSKSLVKRVSVPANLLMVGLIGGIFCLLQLVSRLPTGPLDYVLPFLLLFGHLALAPVPWQWTGDDADRAGLTRGFAQALAFGAVWIGLLLVTLHLLGSLPHEPMPFRPEMLPPKPMPFPPGGQPFPHPLFPRQPFRPGLVLGLVNLAFGAAFGWVQAAKEATEVREERTARLLREAQARALQNQLEPHVLYNALNGLAELIHEDPLAAEEMIAKLADLYRMLTMHGEAGLVRLEQERKLVEAYLDMEQMRLGERLQARWCWPDWADGLRVPPFFLLPLVENAIKHGISPCDAGGELVVACTRQGAQVALQVENTGRPLEGQVRGVGLANLEARLNLWTELAGGFTLGTRDAWTTAGVQWTINEQQKAGEGGGATQMGSPPSSTKRGEG
jgi:hypothetical protein